tara:strand:- start:393 stop:1193 length:801 start_codon:yes stop_codon:yes gene_type:complete
LKISKIFLYDEPAVQEIQISNLKNFLLETFHVDVEIKDCIFNNLDEKMIERISSCRIFEPKIPFKKHLPNKQEINFEKSVCKDTKLMEKTTMVEDAGRIDDVVMYDGFEVQNIISDLIMKNDLEPNNLHIVFTNKLICTYDTDDGRYHGRTVICSNPAIISTTGMIEAPARPREYYFEAMKCKTQGLSIQDLKKNYSGKFLDYHDKRLSKIAEGFLLQAIFYYITGDAFCNSLDCRLNNAHWQKDLLYSQLKIGKLCNKHQALLDN